MEKETVSAIFAKPNYRLLTQLKVYLRGAGSARLQERADEILGSNWYCAQPPLLPANLRALRTCLLPHDEKEA